MDYRPLTHNLKANGIAFAISAGFGLLVRYLYASAHPPAPNVMITWATPIMYVAFFFGVPFAMGYIAVTTSFYLRRKENLPQPSIGYWICFPWLPAFAAMVIAGLFAWEGAICLLFAAPVMLLMASIGGVTGGVGQRRHFRPAQLSAVATLPFALTLLESHIPDPVSTRLVKTSILIHAPVEAVWQNVVRVPAILPSELPKSWVRTVGFPLPVQATLSHDGIGGVRQASFMGGLVFTETIDHWDALHDIRFSIHANTDNIPPTTLDEHVKVGGRYFDVLEGEYRLQRLAGGDTLLHLTSSERVSTHFNAYAGFWTDAVMRSIQNSILQVIRRRAEDEGVKTASNVP